ncbi:CaiB/BaiF CoA-transferase family protein [Streptomyces sp. RPT161]|uniref:CaiB/BaiF CoA-transferase family protein n=1 Tax=Streptomyces sp. RPT161 TaxID=3015993 RepID=UPI0022B858F6|nr:CoA transferase [Streptomyces sp. RPT161]
MSLPGPRCADGAGGHPDAPLAGLTAHGTGHGTAGRVALRHLVDLGATPGAAHTGTYTPAEGDLVTLYRSAGPAEQPLLDCRIDWACPGGTPLADETTVQAATGLMAVHGRNRGTPRRIPVEYASTCAGVIAVQGVLAALVARERGARISTVGTSVAHAALLTISQYLAAGTAPETEHLPAVEGRPGPPFRSRDGVWFEIEALDAAPWRDFWTALGAPAKDISSGWPAFMLRYPKALSPLPPSLHQAVAAVEFARILAVAEAHRMSVCRIRTMAERRTDRDALRYGRVPPPWRFRPYGDASRPRPSATVPGPERPLDGLTVIEAGRRVQAPLAAHMLGLLGARVVRVEPPGGDPLRGMPPMVEDCSARFLALNRTKEAVTADLKTPAGRNTVRELARDADVFLHNWAPGKAAEFQLDAPELAALNPRLVYGYASGWGDALGERPPLGTDFMAQAHSGLADLMADGDRPRPSLMTLLDVLGGLVAAEGLLAALVARERTGRGRRMDSSLLSASTVLQYQALERPQRRHAPGCGTAGLPEVEGPYRTADGWLAVSAGSTTAVGRLCRELGLDPAAPQDVLRRRIADRLADRPAAEWVARFATARVSAAVVATDLDGLDTAPATAPALTREACTFVNSPWRFGA